MYRPDQIEQLFIDRITALDASAYDQDPEDVAWRATDFVGADTLQLARSRAHLAFDVVWGGATDGEDERIPYTGDILVESSIAFVMIYNIRRGSEQADRRLASRAAWDAVGAMGAKSDDLRLTGFSLDPADFNRETGLLLMEAEISVLHEMSF